MSILNKILGEKLCRALGLNNKEEFERIKIEDNLLSISEDVIIPIDNIARIASQVVVVPWIIRIFMFALMMGAFFFGFVPIIGDVSWAFGILVLIGLIWTFQYKAYGVRIEPVGQMADLLSTQDKVQADNLFKALILALKDGGRTHSIVVTNENGNVTIVKGDHVEGDLFKGIQGSSIANKSEISSINNV